MTTTAWADLREFRKIEESGGTPPAPPMPPEVTEHSLQPLVDVLLPAGPTGIELGVLVLQLIEPSFGQVGKVAIEAVTDDEAPGHSSLGRLDTEEVLRRGILLILQAVVAHHTVVAQLVENTALWTLEVLTSPAPAAAVRTDREPITLRSIQKQPLRPTSKARSNWRPESPAASQPEHPGPCAGPEL